MEKNKYISLGDSYIDINEIEDVEYTDEILDGETQRKSSQNHYPKLL